MAAELSLLTSLHSHLARGVCAMGHGELTERTSIHDQGARAATGHADRGW